MDADKLDVLAYRMMEDTDNKLRDKLIIRYMRLVKRLAARFIGPRHPRDDINEYAMYVLVDTVVRAKESLTNNNIQPYIIKCVRAQLMNYVTFDHVSTVPQKRGTSVWNRPRQIRHTLKDCPAIQCDVADSVCLCESIERSILSDTQREVVELYLAGFTFPEIVKKTNISLGSCYRMWCEFTERMRENE